MRPPRRHAHAWARCCSIPAILVSSGARSRAPATSKLRTTSSSYKPNSLNLNYIKNFLDMNPLVSNVAYALHAASPLPMLGPGADVQRAGSFRRGKAWSMGGFKNYSSVQRAGLLAECRARGLEQTGTMQLLKARLGRSDDGMLDGTDWRPLAAAGPATDLDSAEVTVSDMDYDALRQLLHDQQLLKGDDWSPAALPPHLGAAEAPKEYALRLIRQHARAALNAPTAAAPADTADAAGGGEKRKRDSSATELDAELRVRGMRLQSFLLTDPGQVIRRQRLLTHGAFTPEAAALVNAVLLPGVDAGDEFSTAAMAQAAQAICDAIGGPAPAPNPAAPQSDASERQAMEARLMAAISRASGNDGQVQKKLARMESRTRTSAACLASVALPAHQARWKSEITELQRELDEAEDMESEMLSRGSDVPPSLAARLKRLRSRFELATIAAGDGEHGLEVMDQLKQKDIYGADALAEYQALEKSLKKYKEKTGKVQGFVGGGAQQFSGRGSFQQFGGAHAQFAGGGGAQASFHGSGLTHQSGFRSNGGAGAPPSQAGGRGADMVRPAWMQQPPGIGAGADSSQQFPPGQRLRGVAGHVIHIVGRTLTAPVVSAAVGGTIDNSAQLCRMCGQAGHIMFECPQLRQKFAAGEVNEHGHPV